MLPALDAGHGSRVTGGRGKRRIERFVAVPQSVRFNSDDVFWPYVAGLRSLAVAGLKSFLRIRIVLAAAEVSSRHR